MRQVGHKSVHKVVPYLLFIETTLFARHQVIRKEMNSKDNA